MCCFLLQAQFNAYVIQLRGEYNSKVATVKHFLESHQADAAKKQKFYEEAIKVCQTFLMHISGT